MAKIRVCRIKTHLPRGLVHKAGSAQHRGTRRLHVCIQTVSSPGFSRAILQRNGVLGSMTQSTMRLTVNGKSCAVDAAPDTALLYILRNDLALNGPKSCCG